MPAQRAMARSHTGQPVKKCAISPAGLADPICAPANAARLHDAAPRAWRHTPYYARGAGHGGVVAADRREFARRADAFLAVVERAKSDGRRAGE